MQLLKFSKMKFAKMSEFSLISFVGISVFNCFVCVKVIKFFHDFIMSNLGKTKIQVCVTLFLNCFYTWMRPVFYYCFLHWVTYILTHWFCILILRLYIMLEKKLFKTVADFLSFSTRIIFSLETTLFDNRGFTTLENFLFSHKFFSLRFPKSSLSLFRKSVTHKFVVWNHYFYFPQSYFLEKRF